MQMFSEPDQPKESKRNDFHFPLSTSFAEQNQAPITYIYDIIYIYMHGYNVCLLISICP